MTFEKTFALKGNILFTPDYNKMEIHENSYLVCENGTVKCITNNKPENMSVYDMDNKIIIPGMTDLHLHAPQYTYRATGMDLELLDWLESSAFPEEKRYADNEYAKKAYSIFTEDLVKSPTTRAVIFATVHKEATLILMDMLEKSGLITMVGKVNMDRLCPDSIKEDTLKSAADTAEWAERSTYFKRTTPIITPRFIPSCSDELLSELGSIRKKYSLPVQSHLSENLSEIELVKELAPYSRFYGDAYEHFGLFGKDHKNVMAHCVHSSDEELELIKQNGVFIAHCPQSNINVSSGIAPVRKYMDKGLELGLGTDVAGGFSISMFRAISDAIQVSKLRWRLVDQSLKALNFNEAFYMATKGGGKFFGNTGSFEEGYDADILVLDDSFIKSARPFSVAERLERIIYLSGSEAVVSKYVKGTKVF